MPDNRSSTRWCFLSGNRNIIIVRKVTNKLAQKSELPQTCGTGDAYRQNAVLHVLLLSQHFSDCTCGKIPVTKQSSEESKERSVNIQF